MIRIKSLILREVEAEGVKMKETTHRAKACKCSMSDLSKERLCDLSRVLPTVCDARMCKTHQETTLYQKSTQSFFDITAVFPLV